MKKTFLSIALTIAALLTLAAFPQNQVSAQDAAQNVSQNAAPQTDAEGWVSLFNGKDLTGWKVPEFGGEGEVTVEDGILTIGMGAMISGITLDQPFPFQTNYEIEVTAKRTMGFDFYAAITFPIGEKGYATFINGGWGGGVFGLSCVNGFDASENETMQLITTKNDRWDSFRVRVFEDRIEGWMNDKKIVDCPRDGNEFTTRFEVEYCQPLGISNYCSETKIKSIRYRALKPEETK